MQYFYRMDEPNLPSKTLYLTKYRHLQEREINILEANLIEAENWKDVWVKNGFRPYLVKIAFFWY